MTNAQPGGPLTGRTALVTGAASGIGAAVARRMAADGATVLAVDLDGAGVKAVARDVAGVEPVVCDLSDLAAVDALPGEVDVLVNNAGVQHVAPVHEFDPERFSTILKIMLEAPFRLSRRVLPHMYEQGWGRIINISSVAGLEPGYSPADYASAKAALNSLTLALSSSLARTGITANIVSPGPILTDALQPVIDSTAESRGWKETGEAREQRFLAEVMPLKVSRIGRPDDIGAAVAFFATPAADYITGANLRVDGGQSASI